MADDAQWRRPVVQPQDVVEMLANPLSTPRASSSSSNGYAASSSSAPPRRVHRSASNGAKPFGTKSLRPPQSSYANKNPWLTKRVYQVAEYREDFNRPPRGLKNGTDGVPAPIPVPLHYGEKFREYEEKFVAWLHKKKVTLQDLRGDARRERGYRISFANMRLLGDDPKKPPRAQQNNEGATQDAPLRPRKRGIVRLGDDDDGGDGSEGEYIGDDGPPRKIHIKNEMPSLALLAEPKYTPPADALLLPRSDPKVPVQPTAPPPQSVPNGAALSSSNHIFTQQCRATLPGPKAPHAAFSAAYVKCCCQQCLRDWNIMLTERLDALESEVRVLRKTQQTAPACNGHGCDVSHTGTNNMQQEGAVPDMAIAVPGYDASPKKEVTSEDTSEEIAPKPFEPEQKHGKDQSEIGDNPATSFNDPVEPVNQDKSDADRTNSAVASDASSLLQPGEPPQELPTVDETPVLPTSCNAVETAEVPASDEKSSLSSSSSCSSSNVVKPLPPSWPQRDPIQAQMLHEYNTLNGEILLNEQVVEASLQRVQTTMMTDMESAMQELEQIEQIKTSIQNEMANRDAALAVFIAYTWRLRSQELEARMQQYGTLHLAHVHRASHGKCAALASQLENKQACVARVKAALDALLTSSGGGGTPAAARIDELSALGTELVQAEQAVVALEREQMDEFMRLFQFNHDIRKLCKTVMMAKPASA
ncbi:hypothetical protein FI667_g8478, partial [Globisporangium splendens]